MNENHFRKKKIVISAINFYEGGPLSILKECLQSVEHNNELDEHEFIALVHDLKLFCSSDYAKIKFIEFPKSRTSYFYRIFYEYIYFKKLAKNQNISFWLSLHDMTPNVGGIPQAVYCHNPSPFNTLNFKDIYLQPIQIVFRLFYKYLYRFNIKRNKFVIVQQLWMKKRFVDMFNLEAKKVLIAPPKIQAIPSHYLSNIVDNNCKTFFFPTFPRPFKNIEVIGKAAQLLTLKDPNFKIIITIDGTENKYARSIVQKYKSCRNIEFIGLIEREKVYEYYSKVDVLIFPSKLETWGLPISEFKQFERPILASNLPYAKEAVGGYKKVNFFDPSNPSQLAELMLKVLNGSLVYDNNLIAQDKDLYVKDWNELFKMLLKSPENV